MLTIAILAVALALAILAVSLALKTWSNGSSHLMVRLLIFRL